MAKQGKHVLVTRAQLAGSSPCPLSEALVSQGFRVTSVPMTEIAPVHAPSMPNLAGFNWLFFTSANAVRCFNPADTLPPVGVVGKATGDAVNEAFGVAPAFVSPGYNAQNAAEAFIKQHPPQGLRILWPCGNLANPVFEKVLSSAGAQVTPLVVYQTTDREIAEREPLKEDFDIVAFSSPSAIHNWQRLQLNIPTGCAIACIGPSTAQAAQQTFGRADIIASPHTLEALAKAISLYLT